jgi:hypothetical protein
MKRFLFVVMLLGLFGTALVGCRVSGEIDDRSSTVLPQ